METQEMLMRPTARLLAVLCGLLLSGCGAVAVETATIGWEKTQVWANIDAARAGDPEAQYAVGEALCCSGDTATGTLYSTEDAMKWLCAASAQGNTDAMLKLGQIFEGDQVDGLRLMRRAMNAVTDTPQNIAAAYYWYAQAGNAGVTESTGTADELFKKMSAFERATARGYLSRGKPPCSWADLRASGE